MRIAVSRPLIPGNRRSIQTKWGCHECKQVNGFLPGLSDLNLEAYVLKDPLEQHPIFGAVFNDQALTPAVASSIHDRVKAGRQFAADASATGVRSALRRMNSGRITWTPISEGCRKSKLQRLLRNLAKEMKL